MSRPALELVESLCRAALDPETEAQRSEVLLQMLSIQRAGVAAHRWIRLGSVAELLEIALGHRFEIEEAAGHGGEVFDGGDDAGARQVREDALRDHQIEFLARPPL